MRYRGHKPSMQAHNNVSSVMVNANIAVSVVSMVCVQVTRCYSCAVYDCAIDNWADLTRKLNILMQYFYRATLCMCGILAMGLCLSVTSRYSTKTAKRRITQTKPHDSSGSLVFWCQRSPWNSTVVTPYWDAKCSIFSKVLLRCSLRIILNE